MKGIIDTNEGFLFIKYLDEINYNFKAVKLHPNSCLHIFHELKAGKEVSFTLARYCPKHDLNVELCSFVCDLTTELVAILECQHSYSKAMNQEYPRKCIKCGEPEKINTMKNLEQRKEKLSFIIESQEKELAKQRAELLKLEEQLKKSEIDLVIKSIEEFTPEEKIEKFNNLHKFVVDMIQVAIRDGYFNDDNGQFCFEELMSIIARDRGKFWEFFNKTIN
jgi:hypothetical protein